MPSFKEVLSTYFFIIIMDRIWAIYKKFQWRRWRQKLIWILNDGKISKLLHIGPNYEAIFFKAKITKH